MTKVVIDMSMSLDRSVAGPDDGRDHRLGRHGGMHIFDWYLVSAETELDAVEVGRDAWDEAQPPRRGTLLPQLPRPFRSASPSCYAVCPPWPATFRISVADPN